MERTLERITELRNRIILLAGPGHGAELQEILAELKALHQPASPEPPKQVFDEEAALRKFIRRPGLPPNKAGS